MNTRHTLTVALLAVISGIVQIPPSSAAQTYADGESAERPISIPVPEAFAHVIAGPYLIHSTVPELSFVGIRVVVSPTGTVVSATPISGSPQWYEKATALAMAWRLMPFQRKGKAIYGKFSFSVDIVPPEKRPEQHTSFPEVNDWDSVRITLERTGCYGSCPAYKLTIFGDGRVLYHGDRFVDYCGDNEYRGHVSPESIRQLVDLFRSADYFDLFDRYVANASDEPAFTTSISFDNKTKSVVDYVGLHVGMPEIVRTVEDGIDRLAGPKVWAKETDTHSECWGLAPMTTSDLPSRID